MLTIETINCHKAYFKTWIMSEICDRAGVPETAKEDNLGIRETISLERIQYSNTSLARYNTSTYSVFPPPAICTSSIITQYHSHMMSGLLDLSKLLYWTLLLLGLTGGGRATPKSCCKMLYVVITTSYPLT